MKRLLFAAMAAAMLMIGLAGSASAIDVPGIDVCPKVAPVPQSPDSDLPGIFLVAPEKPISTDGPVDPTTLLETSGLSGMEPFTYDLGCKLNPASYGDQVRSWGDQSLDSKFVVVGQTATAATDAVDRLAWSPQWITSLLGTLSASAIGTVSRQVLFPFLGVGLVVTTLMMRRKMRQGNTAAVASHVTWAAIVLAVCAFVSLAPVMLSSTTQSGLGAVSAALRSDGRLDSDPATAATDSIIRTVHYNGWLRRTFGTADSDTAAKYGPSLLADTRMTWAEQQATDPSLAKNDKDRSARLDARKKLLTAKSDDFKKIAGEVKQEDPAAYSWLTGKHGSSAVGIYEMGFALVAAYFRMAVAILMVLALILLTGLGIVWLVAAPWLVTPKGEIMGRNLLDSTARAIGYSVSAAIGSWLFSVYTDVVMQPGWPSWLSLLMLLVGTWAFWTAIRPERKFISLLTDGKVRGSGRWQRKFTGRLLGYATGGAAAGYAFAKAAGRGDDDEEREVRTAEELASYDFEPTVPNPITEDERAAEAHAEYFMRDETRGSEFVPDPVPPPDGTIGEEPFVRDYDAVRREHEAAWDNDDEFERARNEEGLA